MIKLSKKHLSENNMTYLQHLNFASKHGLLCIKAGLLLICHSIIPAIFPKTGSQLVNKLNKSFVDHNEYIILKRENHVT